MTEIPPDIPASAAQAGFQAHEVAKERDARRAGQTDAASRQARKVTEAGSTVETTDADVAIFADSEGSGSQGRAFEEEAESTPDKNSGAGGVTTGADGKVHIDMEA